MVMKYEVLCRLFVRCFGLDRAQNTILVYPLAEDKPIAKLWLRNSCTVYKHNVEDCVRSMERKSGLASLSALTIPPILATVECRFFEPLRETKIGSKTRRVREISGKITVFDWGGKRLLVHVIGGFEWEIRIPLHVSIKQDRQSRILT